MALFTSARPVGCPFPLAEECGTVPQDTHVSALRDRCFSGLGQLCSRRMLPIDGAINPLPPVELRETAIRWPFLDRQERSLLFGFDCPCDPV